MAAQRLGIGTPFLGRITGTIRVCHGDKYTDIGLNLKFTKRQEEAPGYTKSVEGRWLYSEKAIDVLTQYMQRYRKVPKFSDARNFAVIYLKFKQRGQT